MLQEFDLWLDESGTFTNEKITVSEGKNPSLIGGWLIPHNKYKESTFADMVVESEASEGYHSAGLKAQQKNEEVIPNLVRMHDEFGGRLFFIENREVRQYGGNRELYLSMMAYGLLHLLQELNAEYESVHLYVTIARRVEKINGEDSIISDEEYRKRLNSCIRMEKAAGHIVLDENTQMEFHVDSARNNTKLKMADYACNAELTISSGMFNDASRISYFQIRKDALVYSFVEDYEENRIRQYLTQDNIGDALTTAIFSRKKGLLKKMLPLIINRLVNFGYRGARVQLDQCIREFTTDAYMEDDFEEGERILKNLLNTVIPAMYKVNLPCEKLHFAAELHLTDMYLREGDLCSAMEEIKNAEAAQKKLPDSLENTLTYYQLMEKQALCQIDTFQFKEAYKLMGRASKAFEEILQALELSDIIHKRYPGMISEYYGDALCMKIYAGMLEQHEKPKLYEELTADSNIALLQYGPHEGELERHRQYRAFIEAQAGNIYEACVWLFMIELPDVDSSWLKKKRDMTADICTAFLNRVNTGEIQASRLYYLMYYTRIMYEAFASKDPLASVMLQALLSSGMELEPEKMKDHLHINARGRKLPALVVDSIEQVSEPDTRIEYHPSESIYWRTAYCLYQVDQKQLADAMYEKAANICFQHKEYLQLMVTGLGIQAERLALLYKEGTKGAEKKAASIRKRLLKEIEAVNKAAAAGDFPAIQALTKELAEEIKDEKDCNWRKLWKTARKISF